MMNEDNNKNQPFLLTKNRIEALADGIFAFAMTLLVLNLAIPDAVRISDADLINILSSQAHRFFNYALAFLLLGNLWVVHHQQFHSVQKVDSRLIWINIFILLFIALMPFSTDLIGDYSGTKVAEIFFCLNLFIVGSLYFCNWMYTAKNHKLVAPNLDALTIQRGIRRNLVTPAISRLAILVTLLVPSWGLLTYLFVPVIMATKPFRRV
jgi:uncharacterized membrane protein